MSQAKIYTIRDVKAGSYSEPFYALHVTDATRQIKRATMDERTNLFHFPGDFELFYIGEFDKNTGHINQLENPEFVVSCASLKEQTGIEDAVK